MERIKIKLNGGIMPKKANATDAGFDLFVPVDVTLKPGRQVIDLRFQLELPVGYAATIQPRSGFSAKGMEVKVITKDSFESHTRVNADVLRGLVDCDYRGSVGVIVKYEPNAMFSAVIERGTRIAQMQIVSVPDVELVASRDIDMSSDRGGGFGHTGV